MKYICSLLLVGFIFAFDQAQETLYSSENLIIYQVTESTYVHVSYLETDDYGKVACNGMIFRNNNEAAVFDTPTNDEASAELINWLQNEQKLNVVAVVPTHWHSDCLGGLGQFHDSGATSFANELTVQLASEDGQVSPKNGFKKSKNLKIGNQEIELLFPGVGHTFDNIVAYVPSEKVLFGGCLVKSLNAGKGWTGDGDTKQWPKTIETVKVKYPNVQWVIPGHGKSGDQKLLDYTIDLFSSKK